MAYAAAVRRDDFNKAAFFSLETRQQKKPSKFKSRLKKIFLCAVMGISVLVPMQRAKLQFFGRRDQTAVTDVLQQEQQPGAGYHEEQPYVSPRAGAPESSRGLTAGEARLIRGLFGEKMDLNGVRLHTFAKEDRNYVSDVMPGDAKNVEFYGRKNSSQDFSRDEARRFGSFVHEMTYLLQNQQGGKWRAGDVKGYDYPLGSQWDFSDYGPEQQRAIVEDYALRFLHPGRQSRYLPHKYGDDRMDTDPHLIRLVENHFRGAKELRISFQNIESRRLTSGEIALLKGIFGDQIDAGIMTQHMHPQEYSDIAGTATSGRDANYWGPRYTSPDYSQEKSPDKFGTFVHENTHLWQYQTRWRHSPYRPGVYRYPLETKWKFTDYTHEQQAAIVEDYALYYLHPSRQMRWMPETYNYREQQEKLPLLKKLVEDQFPGARALRETCEAQRQSAKKPAAVSFQWQPAPAAFAPAFG